MDGIIAFPSGSQSQPKNCVRNVNCGCKFIVYGSYGENKYIIKKLNELKKCGAEPINQDQIKLNAEKQILLLLLSIEHLINENKKYKFKDLLTSFSIYYHKRSIENISKFAIKVINYGVNSGHETFGLSQLFFRIVNLIVIYTPYHIKKVLVSNIYQNILWLSTDNKLNGYEADNSNTFSLLKQMKNVIDIKMFKDNYCMITPNDFPNSTEIIIKYWYNNNNNIPKELIYLIKTYNPPPNHIYYFYPNMSCLKVDKFNNSNIIQIDCNKQLALFLDSNGRVWRDYKDNIREITSYFSTKNGVIQQITCGFDVESKVCLAADSNNTIYVWNNSGNMNQIQLKDKIKFFARGYFMTDKYKNYIVSRWQHLIDLNIHFKEQNISKNDIKNVKAIYCGSGDDLSDALFDNGITLISCFNDNSENNINNHKLMEEFNQYKKQTKDTFHKLFYNIPPPKIVSLKYDLNRHKGACKIWFIEKGYGFLSMDDGSEIFVHHSDINGGWFELSQNEVVIFDIATNPLGNNLVTKRAINVSTFRQTI